MIQEERETGYTLRHDEIALVVAKQGRSKENDSIVSKYVTCNDFQDGNKFLKNGGLEGRQSHILTEKQYFINPKLFDVITAENCSIYGMKPEQFKKIIIEEDKVGIVTSFVGRKGEYEEVKQIDEELHNNYKNIDAFIEHGGTKGVQENVLQTGEYALNPWCATMKKIPITNIPTGTVGVIVSHTGKENTTHLLGAGIVEEGYVGVWKNVLPARKHPINLETKTVYLIPTMEITLVWSPEDEKEGSNNYDIGLKPITIKTKDNFLINLKLSQTISIRPEEASKLILKISDGESNKSKASSSDEPSKYPAIRNLISKVIKSKIENLFERISGEYHYLQFNAMKSEIEELALEYIQSVLDEYGVDAKRLSILIGHDPSNVLDNMKREQSIIIAQGQIDQTKLEMMDIKHEVDKRTADHEATMARIKNSVLIHDMKEKIAVIGIGNYHELERLGKLAGINFPSYPSPYFMDNIASHLGIGEAKKANSTDKDFLEKIKIFIEKNSIEISKKPKNIEFEKLNDR